MNKIHKKENPSFENLGFFDKIKIEYNTEALKKTFEDYPFVYAYRFIVGCLSTWAFDKKINKKERTKIKKTLFNVLGIREINRELVKEKVMFSKELIKECEKIKWSYIMDLQKNWEF